MRKAFVRNLVLSAFFLALGLLLPFLTGQIPQIGTMLLPMHLPVLFCGLICGWKYGGVVGLVLPPLRYLLFMMPPIYPMGVSMMFELMTYGVIIGLLYARLPRNAAGLYGSLVPAMLAGRLVWGAVRALLSGASDNAFTWELFMSGAFVTAIPGIVLQLILVPALMLALQRVGALPGAKEKASVRGNT